MHAWVSVPSKEEIQKPPYFFNPLIPTTHGQLWFVKVWNCIHTGLDDAANTCTWEISSLLQASTIIGEQTLALLSASLKPCEALTAALMASPIHLLPSAKTSSIRTTQRKAGKIVNVMASDRRVR